MRTFILKPAVGGEASQAGAPVGVQNRSNHILSDGYGVGRAHLTDSILTAVCQLVERTTSSLLEFVNETLRNICLDRLRILIGVIIPDQNSRQVVSHRMHHVGRFQHSRDGIDARAKSAAVAEIVDFLPTNTENLQLRIQFRPLTYVKKRQVGLDLGPHELNREWRTALQVVGIASKCGLG